MFHPETSGNALLVQRSLQTRREDSTLCTLFSSDHHMWSLILPQQQSLNADIMTESDPEDFIRDCPPSPPPVKKVPQKDHVELIQKYLKLKKKYKKLQDQFYELFEHQRKMKKLKKERSFVDHGSQTDPRVQIEEEDGESDSTEMYEPDRGTHCRVVNFENLDPSLIPLEISLEDLKVDIPRQEKNLANLQQTIKEILDSDDDDFVIFDEVKYVDGEVNKAAQKVDAPCGPSGALRLLKESISAAPKARMPAPGPEANADTPLDESTHVVAASEAAPVEDDGWGDAIPAAQTQVAVKPSTEAFKKCWTASVKPKYPVANKPLAPLKGMNAVKVPFRMIGLPNYRIPKKKPRSEKEGNSGNNWGSTDWGSPGPASSFKALISCWGSDNWGESTESNRNNQQKKEDEDLDWGSPYN